jgi:molybdenum cofactor guanylyltransferase
MAGTDERSVSFAIDRGQITGLVLAGGRGSRMGGVDKGLQAWRGQPLVQHALQRLQPQVGPLMINANRNLDAYASMGAPVWPDAIADYPGPLGGFLAGLAHCQTAYLVTVPCDSPVFPVDLVARLAEALASANADVALAASTEADGQLQPQPVFCLLRATLKDSLAAAMAAGERKIDRWAASHPCVTVPFDDPAAFFNANTLDDLRR